MLVLQKLSKYVEYLNLPGYFRFLKHFKIQYEHLTLFLMLNIHVIFSRGGFKKISILELEKSFVLACFMQDCHFYYKSCFCILTLHIYFYSL